MAAIAGMVGIGATVAGGALQADAARQGGAAQQQMYNYQSQVAKINSQIDLQNADYARSQGEVQAVQSGMRYRQEEGQILVHQAASNLDVNSGSNLEVQRSERTLAGIDAGQIRSNAAKTAYDFDVKSVMDLNQSTLDTMAGVNAKAAGDIQADISIVGTTASVASKWMQMSQSGMGAGIFGGSGGGVGFVSGL